MAMDAAANDDHASPTQQKHFHSRKSIAHTPSPDTISGIENKENMTADISTMTGVKGNGAASTKKSRSKSIGPGGLDALKEDPGNRRKSTIAPVVKSILKPTIPLSPPKPIPPHTAARKRSPSKIPLSPSKRNQARGPVNSSDPDEAIQKDAASVTEANRLSNPFEGSSVIAQQQEQDTRVALRTEEEQQAAVKEREEKERRELEKKDILGRRDARRKSLANRRVSFAPEATLHTWDVVELAEDSTTSSASTNATRRASSMSSASATSPYPQPRSPLPSSDPSEPPSTPPEQVEETLSKTSPAHQRDLHQKKRRRRSSVVPPMNFNNPDDEFLSSSPLSGSSAAGSEDTANQTYVTADGDDSSTSEDDGVVVDEGESTVMELDGDDITGQSEASTRSNGSNGGSTGSSGKLEAALRQAAKQAGTQGIEFDEHGDLTMDMADDEVTAASQPWIKQGTYIPKVVADLSSLQDQENINPFSPAFKASVTPRPPPSQADNSRDDEEMSMDITRAVGGILPAEVPPSVRLEHPVGSSKRRSNVSCRRSSDQSSSQGDETMDLTAAVGGIQAGHQIRDQRDEPSNADKDEELTMEFTSVVGGLINKNLNSKYGRRESVEDGQLAARQLLQEQRRDSAPSTLDEDPMDITVAIGGILPKVTKQASEVDHESMDMDITAAIGSILPKQLSAGSKSQAKALMEAETDAGQLTSAPFREQPLLVSPSRSAIPNHVSTVASETGSPSLTSAKTRGSARKSIGSRQSTPGRVSRQVTPVKKPSTPSKQLTPNVPQPRPTTPGKTPPCKNVTFRTASPKKLFKAEIRSAQSTPKPGSRKNIFRHDATTGVSTPSVVLTPQARGTPRRTSGLGVDKPGLGSPRVAALLDRRGSIGEQAETFTPQSQVIAGVRFEDPRIMEQELEKEREEEHRRESGRFVLEREADNQEDLEKDATINLKEMIESLTPKKKKLNGRKSLHVGAARGILGKRPIELDDDQEDEDSTPKRLKGIEGSPVKNVKLPGPPSKVETAGRISRASRKGLGRSASIIETATPTTAGSPVERVGATTPKNQGRFRDIDAEAMAMEPPVSFGEKLDTEPQEIAEPADEEDPIHLQDFLNMTSIRFMELTTTKRRHTVAPNASLEDSARKASVENKDDKSGSGRDLESCVVAGACTVPMLQLCQHSCRELKKYISEGRSIVREIEAETFEDNPPLFREYISAAPDVKFIMDNQFKNVKTHARLSSKSMWYEWRMKLLDELKKGLVESSKGMKHDHLILKQLEELLVPVLPAMLEQHESLGHKIQQLQTHAHELANCDQTELKDAREKLHAVEEEIEAKRNMVEEMQQKLKKKEDGIEDVLECKEECLEQIREAERVREECKGWSASEVGMLNSNVDSLEKAHGWTIMAASGTSLTMTYHRTLQLFFDVASFLPNSQSMPTVPAKTERSPISLTYIADNHEYRPQPLTTEKRFFLQIMRAQLQCMPQNLTKVKDLLSFVSKSWQVAEAVAEESRVLNLSQITTATILSDDVLALKSVLLLSGLKTKVESTFEISTQSSFSGIQAVVKPSARVLYGENYNEEKMGEFLATKVSGHVTGKEDEERGSWGLKVRELGEKLIARGKKQ
ncbi:MAG: hypothetical protein M1830_008046 [Pleopsidium flavum]|nr:MAG: hypothetical protein M1830_008046 [Pleopsidium flavum]